jgi:hypothetical protein
MKRPMVSAVVIAFVHAVIILSLGMQAAIDQERLPRAWAQAVAVSAGSRVHGRYLTVNVSAVTDAGLVPRVDVVNGRSVSRSTPIALEARDGRLVAHKAPTSYVDLVPADARPGAPAMIAQRVEYFLPPAAGDPMPLLRRGELWVEVSVPPQGPPRPLRLGKMADGKIVPLAGSPVN